MLGMLISRSLATIARTLQTHRPGRRGLALLIGLLTLVLLLSPTMVQSWRPRHHRPHRVYRPRVRYARPYAYPRHRVPDYRRRALARVRIVEVWEDERVMFETGPHPAGQTLQVSMGPMHTRGHRGIVVGEFESGDGGISVQTMPIPAELQGLERIVIRIGSQRARRYHGMAWFYNHIPVAGETLERSDPGEVPGEPTLLTIAAGETAVEFVGQLGAGESAYFEIAVGAGQMMKFSVTSPRANVIFPLRPEQSEVRTMRAPTAVGITEYSAEMPADIVYGFDITAAGRGSNYVLRVEAITQ